MQERPNKAKMPQFQSLRTGLTADVLKRAFLDNLFCLQGRIPLVATRNDHYMALAYTVRDRLLHRWLNTNQTCVNENVRVVCYLSAEFLVGPHLANNIINLGIFDEVKKAVADAGQDLQNLIDQEEEPGLGNGGLGRLAACYLESLATLEIPAIGYGIRYEFGIFDQEMKDGWQVEITDKWLRFGNPWEIARPEITYDVKLGGRTEHIHSPDGRLRVEWVPHRVVKGVAYDTPILGYKVNTCITLRLWKGEACESFDFQAFNVGDYYGAVDEKVFSENITKVLYPNDEPVAGKQLRLEQQYFFVSCSLQDMIRMHRLMGHSLETFHEMWAAQLNDTHPSIAVAELMRLFIDEHKMDWETAWNVTRRTFSYTNHTLLPEALEKWSLPLFARILPRHLEIIYEINQRFLDEVRTKYTYDEGRLSRLSLIDENGDKFVRMANLACVGSHAINGVAELHSTLVTKTVLKDFYEIWPEKFSNKTNGVTPRRWMAVSNPLLTELITSRIGENWLRHLDDLKKLEAFADDKEFHEQWRQVKVRNKQLLASIILSRTGVELDAGSVFDILVKRIHEYKRQHLLALYIITLYNRIKNDPHVDIVPRTFIFGGKAAPGYFMAKRIIKLITSVGDVVNNDPDVNGRLKVVFLADFNVKHAQNVYPAADVSEQISMAGKEASGTGNMKFSMNGALTIGTLDGANIEIREEVGQENFFLFGLTAQEVAELKASGYRPRDYYDTNEHLRQTLDLIARGHFSQGDTDLFRPLIDALVYHDDYLLLADYKSYVECQDRLTAAYRDREVWTRMSILNVARIGKFSSDRSIEEYCRDIWRVKAVPVELKDFDMISNGNERVKG